MLHIRTCCSHAFHLPLTLLLTAACGVALPADASAQDAPDPADRQLYFGEQHLHSEWSPDAYATGVRQKPEDAYRWALGEEITLRIDNYGREVPGRGRLADAYNLRSVRIVVSYEDGTTQESKRFAGPVCSVPSWQNCQGTPVKRWGDPVEIRF